MSASPRRRRVGVAGIAAVLAAAASAAPTGASAGDVRVHGLLDLVMAGKSEAAELNTLWKGDSRFDTYAARLFIDGTVSDRVRVFTQLYASEELAVRPMGAYAMIDPWEGKDVHVVAGLIPFLIGTYDAPSYSDKNPLVGIPMLYQHHTTLRWDQMPSSADALLAKAGTGYRGVNYTSGGPALAGLPVIYQHWWDFGVGLTGSLRPLEFAIGIENGTPSFPDPTRDQNSGKAIVGRLGLAPAPAWRFGVSGAYGPYLVHNLATPLPAGRRAEDYNQILAMADAEWSAGHLSLRAEGYHNTWETPALGNLDVRGVYAEAKVTLPAGLYAAGRYEIMRFSDLSDSTGLARPWDTEWDRGEAGLGYRAAKDVIVKAVYQWNAARADFPGDHPERLDLLAGQLSIRF